MHLVLAYWVTLSLISVASEDPGLVSLKDVLFFVGLAQLATLESFQCLYDLSSCCREAEITNGAIQGRLRRVILLLIAQTSHECYCLSISKTVVVFPPHNLR